MECYAYSVLTRWFSSVYSGAGSRPFSDQMAKQNIVFHDFFVFRLKARCCVSFHHRLLHDLTSENARFTRVEVMFPIAHTDLVVCAS